MFAIITRGGASIVRLRCDDRISEERVGGFEKGKEAVVPSSREDKGNRGGKEEEDKVEADSPPTSDCASEASD